MDFYIESRNNSTVIQIQSEKLDTHIAPALKSELVLVSGKGEKNIILDLEKCQYCDSSGLSAILVGNRLCDDSEGTFIICNLSQNVEKMIKLAMLDSILLIAAGVEEAEKLLIKKSEML